ncbi:hypothetical protein N0V82_002982 [Gnomoniopsis sp. IMI 355080]|nr:hypothetical protein N0V82_002982 [Gnomoniopsis sp. IMI 355080]
MAQSTMTASLATTTTSSAAATSTPLDYEAICESQASGYTDKCPQCLSQCTSRTTEEIVAQCYYSVFFEINYLESVCEAEGGNNCEGSSVDEVCGSS